MSDTIPAGGPKTFLSISKEEFDKNIFGSPLLHSLIKLAYSWGIFMILGMVLVLSPTFIFALIALIISRVRYSATKLEKDVEKHGDFIAKVSKHVFTGTGVRLQPEHVVRLWMNKMIIAEGWLITVKNPNDGENFEIIGSEIKK